MSKRLILPGGILWIAGLVLSIVGMNIQNDTGRLLAVIGNIVFLIGLAIVGAGWFMARKKEEAEARNRAQNQTQAPEQNPEQQPEPNGQEE